MGAGEGRATSDGWSRTSEESVREDLFKRETAHRIEDEDVTNQIGGIYDQSPSSSAFRNLIRTKS